MLSLNNRSGVSLHAHITLAVFLYMVAEGGLLLLSRLLASVQIMVPLKFGGQKGVDHCETSAIAIAIQFAQSYSSGI